MKQPRKWNLETHSSADLLALYADILDELQKRKVVHSTNNPVANYSEKLASEALGLKLMTESTKGFDGIDAIGNKYEVKGRRPTTNNPSRQLSMLRGLKDKHFDFLVGILYEEDFRVSRGCVIPHNVILSRARFSNHANAHIFHLTDDVWKIGGVRDITDILRRAQNSIA
ncbi:MAG: hypothetical protein HY079_14990 [Elusimicrobia bacterium]|nr:hypothetical protein [Elusimicrobiota bacterium]